MKKVILLFGIATLIAGCGGNGDKKPTTTESQTAETKAITLDTQTVEKKTTAVPAKQDYEKGFGLISNSDCSTCHKVAEKMIGPTYEDVAKRYAGKAGIDDTLVQKIIKGGSGNWGQSPMAPHPGISVEDARAMVDYILGVNR